MNVEIRRLATPDEAELAVELQRVVWGGSEVVGHVLLTAAHNGGLLAGALVDGVLAGFVWGFLGLDERVSPPRLKHCSHQLGVHPAYRNHGLGFLLKRFQWEFVRSQGIDLITWTFDPLLAANAHLNIARLGATCNTYRRDEYGHLDDELNADLPTDRFQVDLWVNSARVTAAMSEAQQDPAPLERCCLLNAPAAGGNPVPPQRPDPTGLPERVAVAIPAEFQLNRAAQSEVGLAWRCAVRDTFETMFAGSYTVVDFARERTCGYYVLERQARS